MIRVSIRRLAMACAMLVMPAAAGYSQETTGTILGALVDQTGGVLPGVKVVMTNVDTGHIREVVTNSVGQYTASVPIGNYEISFLFPNFQPFITRGLRLHVNDRLQVNGTLRVGAIETLTVSAQLLQATSDVRNLIPRVAVEELPLLTRTFVQLATLVPGVSSDLREDACFCDQGNLNVSINGARRSATNWLLDGASNVNGWNNYTLVTTPSLEAIQEINVITSSYSAEWARNGGGVINAVTKSGSKRFSGSAYDFLRNDALNANSFFRKMSTNPEVNSTPRRLRYNNFGYTLGGPALPSRESLFFFFSEEWRRSSRDKSTEESRVPDPSWLTNPASPEYVPPELRDANAVALLTLWPSPNVPGTNVYRTTIPNELDTRQQFVRADYNVSASWSVTGRYLHDRLDSRGEYVTHPDLTPGHRSRVGHLAVVEARQVGGQFVFEASYQLSRHQQARKDVQHTKDDVDVLIPELFPENAANLIPTVYVSGLSGLETFQPGPREYLNHSVSAALTLQRGSHTVKTGGLLAFERTKSNLFQETTQGVFVFGPGGGLTAFQHFLRGNPEGACGQLCLYTETDIDVTNRFRSGRYELYFQDTWRAHPTLTLDFGLRYAFYPPVTDDRDMLFTFAPDAYNPAQAASFADSFGGSVRPETGNLLNGIVVAGRDSPHGRAVYPADLNNLQPRVGVAWAPGDGGRMVVRSGYGIYHDQTSVEMLAEGVEFSTFDPFRTDLFVRNAPLSNPGGGSSSPQAWPKPRELLFQAPGSPVPTPRTQATSDRLVAPRWQHWNIGVQRRLYSAGLLDVGYVGSRGDHLVRYVDLNRPQAPILAASGLPPNFVRPFPGYTEIAMRETTAKSQYHGLLVSLRHDAARTGSVAVNYSLGRNNTDATYDNSRFDDPQDPLDKGAEYASAGTDRTQIFTASYVYELPLAREETRGWRKGLLEGWQLAGITRIESGPAARLRVTNCNYNRSCFPGALRPDQVNEAAAGDQTGLLWFNPAAFVPSPAGEYGDAPVAPFRLPGRHQWDFAISKNVRLGGTTRLQLRADFINAFNQTQFLDVNTSCVGTTTCERPGSTFGQVTSTHPPREIQLGVRFHW